MSKLGNVNFWIVQWFFFRIGKMKHDDGKIQWCILFPILPLTGWWSNYIPNKYKIFKLKSAMQK